MERISYVYLNCSIDGSEEFEVLGEDPIRTYKFRLTHICACWDACNSKCYTVNKCGNLELKSERYVYFKNSPELTSRQVLRDKKRASVRLKDIGGPGIFEHGISQLQSMGPR
jgi:hypothetical protein